MASILPLTVLTDIQTLLNGGSNGFRPPQWGSNKPAPAVLTVPVTSQAASTSPSANGPSPKVYVFDAIFKTDHETSIHRTEFPVQTMNAITDHAYIRPTRVVLEIGMSDSMASYTVGQWTSAPTKSVSAYQTLVTLQQSRVLVSLTTRLQSYTNLLIDSISTGDNRDTYHALKATIVFSQVFLASAELVASSFNTGVVSDDTSARPQTTGATGAGVANPTSVPASVTAQNQVTTAQIASFTTGTATGIAGAGLWSSTPTSGLSWLK